MKGLVTINDIQYYICRKTKLWIDRSGLEYLKKSEEREDWQWFVHLARDQMSYIGVYRKSIDQLELIKSECWKMISDPDRVLNQGSMFAGNSFCYENNGFVVKRFALCNQYNKILGS